MKVDSDLDPSLQATMPESAILLKTQRNPVFIQYGVKPDGTIEFLYDVVLASEGIRMREYDYPQRVRERATLPMPTVNPTEVLTEGEFLRRTQPLYMSSLTLNCRFFVVIYDATGPTEKELYKHQLRTVEGYFYKRLDRGTAPF